MASRSVEYPLYQPQNGWAEQDPQDWWHAAAATIRGVLETSGVAPGDVRGLGISGQMHGLVLLDERGEPLGRSLLWCDGRTQRECDEITQAVGAKRLIEIAANPALTGFTAGKILWVRRHQPELFARARHALLPKDYVRYRLTGVIAQEISDASGTNLLDVPARRWSAEIMDKLGLDMSLLPPLVESSEAAGTITPEAAALTGLRAGTVVAGGAGDNMAAAIGTGVAQSGKAFTTIGTSGVVFAHSDAVSIDPEGRVHTFCAAVPAHTRSRVTLAAGLSLKWYRDQFCQAERDGRGPDGRRSLRADEPRGRAKPHRREPAAVSALPDGRAQPAFGRKRARRVHRAERHPHPARPAACGDGGRDLLPAAEPRHPARHGRQALQHAGLRRRRAQPLLAADDGRRVRPAGSDRAGARKPGAWARRFWRAWPRACTRTCPRHAPRWSGPASRSCPTRSAPPPTSPSTGCTKASTPH